jgi:PAS domain S-box-containing protein
MGSASSIASAVKDIKRREDKEINDGLSQYESEANQESYDSTPKSRSSIGIFAQEIYWRLSKTEGLKHILSIESGREAFMSFLNLEFAEEKLWFFMAVDEIKKVSTSSDFKADAEILVSKYLSPDRNTKIGVPAVLRESLTKMVLGKVKSSPAEILSSLVVAQEKVFDVMVQSAFPRFLLSSIFTEWRQSEMERAITSLQKQTTGRTLDEIRDSETVGSEKASFEPTNQNPMQKMALELDRALFHTSWLTGLLTSVENLPVCVSLASASKHLPGFPLIYVNAAFESTTGYSREEIIGKNCKFLQEGKSDDDVAEKESIERLQDALKNAKPVKVAITNWKNDGTKFRNLLAIKPIFDQDGAYAFVLGIQFDIGIEGDVNAEKIMMVDDLYRALPDSVSMDRCLG